MLALLSSLIYALRTNHCTLNQVVKSKISQVVDWRFIHDSEIVVKVQRYVAISLGIQYKLHPKSIVSQYNKNTLQKVKIYKYKW